MYISHCNTLQKNLPSILHIFIKKCIDFFLKCIFYPIFGYFRTIEPKKGTTLLFYRNGTFLYFLSSIFSHKQPPLCKKHMGNNNLLDQLEYDLPLQRCTNQQSHPLIKLLKKCYHMDYIVLTL